MDGKNNSSQPSFLIFILSTRGNKVFVTLQNNRINIAICCLNKALCQQLKVYWKNNHFNKPRVYYLIIMSMTDGKDDVNICNVVKWIFDNTFLVTDEKKEKYFCHWIELVIDECVWLFEAFIEII